MACAGLYGGFWRVAEEAEECVKACPPTASLGGGRPLSGALSRVPRRPGVAGEGWPRGEEG